MGNRCKEGRKAISKETIKRGRLMKERRKKGDKQPWNKGIPKVPVSPDKVDKAEMAFKLYDKDKDGFVTKYEMNRLAKKLTTDQIDQVISGPQTTTLVMTCSH